MREAVAVFPDAAHLDAAVDDLLVQGFDRSLLSLMATGSTVESSLGHAYRRAADVEDDPNAPHVAYVDAASEAEAKGAAIGTLAYVGALAAAGTVVASGGAVAAVIVATALAGGAGGAIGAALARVIGARHAQALAEQLERGGLLLWVRTVDAAAERTACDILAKHGGTDVHVHEFAGPEATSTTGVSGDLAWINKPLASWFGRRLAPS